MFESPNFKSCTILSNLSSSKKASLSKRKPKKEDKVLDDLLTKRNAPRSYKQIPNMEFSSANKKSNFEMTGTKKLKIDEILSSNQMEGGFDSSSQKSKKILDLLANIKTESFDWNKINFTKNIFDSWCSQYNIV